MLSFSKTLPATLLVLAAVAGPASAGAKWTYDVQIDFANSSAVGSLGSSRNSSDSDQYIGCYLNTDGQGFNIGVCLAVNVDHKFAACSFVNNAELQSVVQSLNGDSTLGFGWDKNGSCTWLQVENFSVYEPKQ